MNWRDFPSLAARLAAGAAEADWRAAVSRAYYAAFHVARQLFAGLNFTVPRADRAHQYLVFRLSNCGDSAVEQAGRDLETLRRYETVRTTTTPPRSRRPRLPRLFAWPRASSRYSTPPGWSRPAPG
jgi:hypothetical protein